MISADHVTAIVTGAGGQDGYYLTSRLLGDGSTVHATVRPGAAVPDLASLATTGPLVVHEVDLDDHQALRALVEDVQADEIYNLGGLSSVRGSFADPDRAWRTNASAVQALLEAVRTTCPNARFYQSSSTDMFGAEAGTAVMHDERSAFRPQSPYAAAKAAAHVLCDAYRRAYDLRIACAILSNHESRRRGTGFLTREVVDHVRELRRLRAGGATTLPVLRVGNLASRRDWGFAPDYVDGITRVLRQISVRAEVSGRSPELDTGARYRDYVLGTGELHAVWELVDRSFALGGFDLAWDRSSADPAHWSAALEAGGPPLVLVDPARFRPADPVAVGTVPALAREELGWQPRTGLDTFLEDMLGADRHA